MINRQGSLPCLFLVDNYSTGTAPVKACDYLTYFFPLSSLIRASTPATSFLSSSR